LIHSSRSTLRRVGNNFIHKSTTHTVPIVAQPSRWPGTEQGCAIAAFEFAKLAGSVDKKEIYRSHTAQLVRPAHGHSSDRIGKLGAATALKIEQERLVAKQTSG
jgi:hypothetical protein